MVEEWLRLSRSEPSRFVTVAQRDLEIVTKIGTQINVIQEFEEAVKVKGGLLGRLKGGKS
jgi:hypothetical protein